MESLRKIRFLLIFVSLIIFCYQLNTALQHLQSNDTVDSTEFIPISELDQPPVITFCPGQGSNLTRLAEYGYNTKNNLWKGDIQQLEAKYYNNLEI